MLHLHVRDREGRHLLDAEAYREATAAVRAAAGNDLIVQVTTEAAGLYEPAEQMAVVRELRPEAVSVALKEIIPDPEHEADGAEFLSWLYRKGVMVQYIIYSGQGVTRFQELCRRGIVPGDRHFVIFVLGRYSMGQTSVPTDLLPFLTVHERSQPWAVCAFGRWENAVAMTAMALGGHCRVGFENNLLLSDGSRAADNAALVAQVVAGADNIGRPIADGAAAREFLMGNSTTEGLHRSGAGITMPASASLAYGR